MRQTKFMLAFLAILALAATSCAKLQARDNLNKGVRAFRDAHYENAVTYFQASRRARSGSHDRRDLSGDGICPAVRSGRPWRRQREECANWRFRRSKTF